MKKNQKDIKYYGEFLNNKILFSITQLILILVLCFFHSSCRMSYSFTGTEVPATAKTFSVKYFSNNASLVHPMLSQTLTDKLKDQLQSQTNLGLTNADGDLAYEGEITGYTLQPVAISENDAAQLTQLTVTINVRFFNKIEPENNFETSFSRFQQFSSSQSLSAVEDALIDQITDELIEDIFNKSLVNW